jgi:hypothetical protein
VASPATSFFLHALVYSIIYIDWHCLKMTDVVRESPDFIMADSFVAGAWATQRRWVGAGLVARAFKVHRHHSPSKPTMVGRGHESHRLSFA